MIAFGLQGKSADRSHNPQGLPHSPKSEVIGRISESCLL